MSWLRVDDGFTEHPKLQLLERDPRLWADAMALWLSAGCYCRRAGTGGYISAERLVRLTPLSARRAIAVAEALVEDTRLDEDGAGLWLRAEGGYQVHDYPDYGPSEEREEAPTRPLTGAERSAKYRQRKRAEAKRSNGAERDAAVTANVTNATQRPARPRARTRVPTRPVPIRNNPKRASPSRPSRVT